jgi:hypothetical protein
MVLGCLAGGSAGVVAGVVTGEILSADEVQKILDQAIFTASAERFIIGQRFNF